MPVQLDIGVVTASVTTPSDVNLLESLGIL